MIEYFKSDIFKSDEEIIVHGCNCFCTMGAGIAAQVVRYYPEAWEVDAMTKRGDPGKLGMFTSWTGQHRFIEDRIVTIVNAYTQYSYTRDKVDVDYKAVETVMYRIARHFGNYVIAMPKIGCGLAGGDWEVVSGILEEISVNHGKCFHVYEF